MSERCNCGSGLEEYPLLDARGVVRGFGCEKCEAKRRRLEQAKDKGK